MKIAFATTGDDLDAPLDDRFGQTTKFIVYDLEAEEFSLVDNIQRGGAVPSGADSLVAFTMVSTGVRCLITGHCDPCCHHVLCPLNIKLYNSDATSVSAALEQYRAGQLGADVAVGWWG